MIHHSTAIIGLALSMSGPQLQLREPEVLVRRLVVGDDDTPIPGDLFRDLTLDATGVDQIEEPVSQLVRDAVAVVHVLGVLPTNEDDEAVVERLLARKGIGAVPKKFDLL